MELYFWAFVVAIIIFGVGAGVSIYEGVQKISAPHALASPVINFIVLGFAMVFELGAWIVAFREFRKTKGRRGWLEAVHVSKDPAVFTVLFEDSAAMLGLIVAFVGIALAELLGLPVLDGVASVVIGAILAVTAGLLAFETKGLLIGEGARPSVVAGVEQIIAGQPGILGTNEVLTLHFGPEDVLLTVSLDFADALSSADIETAISDMEHQIKTRFPEITRVFIEAQSWQRHRAAERRSAAAADE